MYAGLRRKTAAIVGNVCLRGCEMTKDDAKDYIREWCPYDRQEEIIKALEQEPKSEWEHDHEILKAYSDGASAVLDKIRAEIEERKLNSGGEPNRELAFNVCLQIIDGYMTEEDKA
jgi:hypothetical protein